MEAQVAQCTAVSQKSEREYITLRDAIKHLGDGWKQDVERLKREMHERETKWKKEAEDVGFKYRRLLSQVEKERALQTSVKELKAEEAEKEAQAKKAEQGGDEAMDVKEEGGQQEGEGKKEEGEGEKKREKRKDGGRDWKRNGEWLALVWKGARLMR